MKTTMSGMKNILEEISSRLDTAEEKTDAFGEWARGTTQNKIKIGKRGKLNLPNTTVVILHVLPHLIITKY